jgi:hypothetical protein
VSLILRRLVTTLALAILLASVTACFDQGAAGVLFLPTWAALFFGWPYLSRKLNFNINISKAPRPRPRRSTAWGRVIVTGLVAFGIALLPVTTSSIRDLGHKPSPGHFPIAHHTLRGNLQYFCRLLHAEPSEKSELDDLCFAWVDLR